MEWLREMSRWTHILFGFVGLTAFWFPIVARKGGTVHVRAGKVFLLCVYVVAATAVLSSVLILRSYLERGVTPAEHPGSFGFPIFLSYLALVTFASARHAKRIIETKRDPSLIRTGGHLALAYASIAASVAIALYAIVFWSGISVLFLVLSVVGILIGKGMLRYGAGPPPFPRAWFYEHMGAMIGAGIAFHTAFAVFGSNRLLGMQPSGAWGIVPWVLPAVVGLAGEALLARRYRKQYGNPLQGGAPLAA